MAVPEKTFEQVLLDGHTQLGVRRVTAPALPADSGSSDPAASQSAADMPVANTYEIRGARGVMHVRLSLGPEPGRAVVDGRAITYLAERDPDGGWRIQFDGVSYRLEVRDERRAALAAAVMQRAPDGDREVRAAMPGTLVQVLVDVGEHVEAGQTVCVLEAMKMQNEVKSSYAGIVKQLVARAGAVVQRRDVLLVLAPA